MSNSHDELIRFIVSLGVQERLEMFQLLGMPINAFLVLLAIF